MSNIHNMEDRAKALEWWRLLTDSEQDDLIIKHFPDWADLVDAIRLSSLRVHQMWIKEKDTLQKP